MKLSEVRDVVREHVGRDKLSDPQLDWCVQRGLRELEKQANFYWMETSVLFAIAEDQQEYTLEDIGVEDFKASEILLVSDRTQTDPTWEECVGPEMLVDTKVNFSEGASGKPAFFTFREDSEDGEAILLWPPLPDQDYRAQWFFYRWTTLPASAVSDSHEVLRRWPEALIFLATEQGVITATKDIEAGQFWRAQFEREHHRLSLYQEKRHQRQRFRPSSAQSSTTLTDRLRQQQKSWM